MRQVQLQHLFQFDPSDHSAFVDRLASGSGIKLQRRVAPPVAADDDVSIHDAFDVLDLNGRPLPKGRRPSRPLLPGVANPGEPLLGSRRLRAL